MAWHAAGIASALSCRPCSCAHRVHRPTGHARGSGIARQVRLPPLPATATLLPTDQPWRAMPCSALPWPGACRVCATHHHRHAATAPFDLPWLHAHGKITYIPVTSVSRCPVLVLSGVGRGGAIPHLVSLPQRPCGQPSEACPACLPVPRHVCWPIVLTTAAGPSQATPVPHASAVSMAVETLLSNSPR